MHRHREGAQQIVRERRIGEFEVPLVVELQQGRGEGVVVLQVQIVHLGLICRVAAFFAHVHLEGKIKDNQLIFDHKINRDSILLTFVLLSLYAY